MVDVDTTLLNELGHLAMLETAGNQAYIFATNRLRDNRGASALLEASCTTWTKAAAKEFDVTVVSTTSGRAVLFAQGEEALREVISTVTRRALEEAPGLTITGAIVPWETGHKFGEALRSLSERVEQIAGEFPPATGRFAQLPPVQICADSHLPAEHHYGSEWISDTRWHKQQKGKDNAGLSPDGLDALVSRVSDARWFAVIHIDGNGAGAAFIGLSELGNSHTNEESLEWYHILSAGLDLAAKCGVEEGRKKIIAENGKVPLVVLVNAGDDVTVICDGADALTFIEAFFTKFEEESKKTAEALKEALEAAGVNVELPWLKDRFTAAAGITLCKPHYPFHAAYDLAEELIQSAKRATREMSSFDVHQLSDVGATSLAEIRARRTSHDGAELWGGPYTLDGIKTLRAALTAAKPNDDESGDTAKISRRSLGKLRAAAFLTEVDFERARTELTKGVPTELTALAKAKLRPQGQPDGDLRRVIVDIADLAEWWG